MVAAGPMAKQIIDTDIGARMSRVCFLNGDCVILREEPLLTTRGAFYGTQQQPRTTGRRPVQNLNRGTRPWYFEALAESADADIEMTRSKASGHSTTTGPSLQKTD